MAQYSGAEDGRIPVVVGVTGHRDVRDISRARSQVEDLLATIRSTFPNSPVRGISSLAEGADRIFAHAVLDAGHTLFAPLPLPVNSYEEDFDTDSRRELHSLLSHQAVTPYVLPFLEGNDDLNTRTHGRARDLQYAGVGVHIVRRCHILVALWDGVDIDKLGGTSWVVRLRDRPVELERYDPYEWQALFADRSLVDLPEFGLTYQIPVARMSDSAISNLTEPFWITNDWGQDCHITTDSFDRREQAFCELRRLDDYNLRVWSFTLQAADDGGIQGVAGSSPAPVSQPPDLDHYPAAAQLDAQFHRADDLANSGMSGVRGTSVKVFWLAGVMAALISVFHIWHGWPLLAAYLLSTLAIVAVLLRMRLRRRESTGEQDRALAEALRVQLYWYQLGVRETVAHHYLQRHRSGMGWVLTALVGASPPHSEPPDFDRWKVVGTEWLKGQSEGYYDRRICKYEWKERKLNLIARAFFVLSVTTVVSDLILLATHLISADSTVERAMIGSLSIAVLGAGLVKGFQEVTLHKEDIIQYTRMSSLFGTAYEKSCHIVDSHTDSSIELARLLLTNTVLRVGKEALREHADWALVHKAHEPSMPTG